MHKLSGLLILTAALVVAEAARGAEAEAGGGSFEVPPASKFGLVVREVANYCCSYVK